MIFEGLQEEYGSAHTGLCAAVQTTTSTRELVEMYWRN